MSEEERLKELRTSLEDLLEKKAFILPSASPIEAQARQYSTHGHLLLQGVKRSNSKEREHNAQSSRSLYQALQGQVVDKVESAIRLPSDPQVARQDRWKTAFKTRYPTWEFRQRHSAYQERPQHFKESCRERLKNASTFSWSCICSIS